MICVRNETADQVETVRAGKEGERRIVHHLASEGGTIVFRDVGKVGDDAVEAPVDGGEEVACEEAGVRNFKSRGIFPRKVEGIWRHIRKGNLPAGAGGGEAQPEDTGAAAHVENLLRCGQLPFQNPFREFLSLGARDQGAGVGFELMLVKPNSAEQVLDRNAFTAFSQSFAQRTQVGLLHRAVELKIEIHPGAA